MATLIKDPNTGAQTLAPGPSSYPVGRTVADLGVSAPQSAPQAPPQAAPPGSAQPGDPYTMFNTALMGILNGAQKSGSTAPLYAQQDELKNESLNLSNPLNSTPYAPLMNAMTPGQSVDAQKDTQSAFSPGISSVTDQIHASTDAMTKFESLVGLANTLGQEVVKVNPSQQTIDGYRNMLRNGVDIPADVLPYIAGKLTNDDWNAYYDHSGKKYAAAPGMFGSMIYNTQNGQVMNGGSQSSSGGQSSQGTKSSVVGNVDFGLTSNGIKPYATDPAYTDKVGRIYTDLQDQDFSNPLTITRYIKNNAPSSPISGVQIQASASKYGVDPKVLTAVLLNESGFGTKGAGAKTLNPGNVGNTDSGATKTFASWQQGIDAAAYQLARRQYDPHDDEITQALNQATGPIDPTYTQLFAKAIKQLENGTPMSQVENLFPAKAAAGARAAVSAAMTTLHPDWSIGSSEMGYKANEKSLGFQQKALDAATNAYSTFDANANLALHIAQGLNQSNSPIINQLNNKVINQFTGIGQLDSFRALITTLQGEYAVLVNVKSGGGGQITDGDKSKASAAIPDDISPTRLGQVITTLKQEGQNAISARQSTVNSITGRQPGAQQTQPTQTQAPTRTVTVKAGNSANLPPGTYGVASDGTLIPQ